MEGPWPLRKVNVDITGIDNRIAADQSIESFTAYLLRSVLGQIDVPIAGRYFREEKVYLDLFIPASGHCGVSPNTADVRSAAVPQLPHANRPEARQAHSRIVASSPAWVYTSSLLGKTIKAPCSE